ncbi:flagellar motor protein MotB [Undibacterium sp.]|uniref:flagellar motor protein MotB n=1 Tax=Undibacterium sp. TaxID=1914977 RepID=UPI002CF9572D|nr:flagellar motor protein MotB [Undibacterium sp.]HTD04159.1 flagellar motor protein MotB [Undibacterium sp.]
MQPSKHDKHSEAVIKRASRKHDDDGHGGAWKVAFADFCLALMCLFLVLWVMAARQQESIQEVMSDSHGGKLDEGQGVMAESMGGPRGSMIERNPLSRSGDSEATGRQLTNGRDDPTEKARSSKVQYESASDLAALSRALASMSADAGLSSNLQSVITPYGLRVMLHDTDKQGMFVRGSAVPTDRFKTLLRKMGPLFAQMENQMLIVGHTDSLQYADTSYSAYSNWTLSSNRAMSARSQLLAGGMPAHSVLQVVGMADRAPLDTKNAAAGINRRIEILVLTSGQAQNIAAMFGMPGDAQAVNKDIDTVIPDRDLLKQLRDKLLPVKGRTTNGN